MKKLTLAVLFLITFSTAASASEPRPLVKVAELDGVINPVSAEFVEKAVKDASDSHAEALVIMLDTPGGLDTSMRKIVKTILASPVPVVTYVGPSGARAASAGVFIFLASPVAAMAPGTNIGAAHPVTMGGGSLSKEMAAKVENDAAAYIRSLADRYGRNADWAEKAVRESVSISDEDAVKMHVADMIADGVPDLINKLDGRQVRTADGLVVLHTKDALVENIEPGNRLKILAVITDPNIAYVLMLVGIIGLFFELSNPGLILPGIIGGISLVLAFYAFQTLPVNYAGVLLIALAIIMFVAEIKIPSYGMLTIGGVISLVLGSLMLIDSPLPYMRISLKVLAPSVIILSGFFFILVRAGLKSRRYGHTTGKDKLVGMVGTARTEIPAGGEGDVFLDGAHWRAVSDEPVAVDEKVRVLEVVGLRLKVGKQN
ncbi:MAG: nodulation protein NfeD [Nitrospirota bacterium]